MGSLIAPLCVGCWLIPLIVIAVCYGLLRSITHAWETRGIGTDGLYCAKCRFDVRGGTGWTCPECGSQLKRWVSLNDPRGGIIVKGLKPPISQGMSILIYLTAGFVPAVVAVTILGLLLPINYRHSASVTLQFPAPASPPTSDYATHLNLYPRAERSWLGPSKLQHLDCWDVPADALNEINASERADEASAEVVWEAVVSKYPGLAEDDKADATRDEFLELLPLVCAFDERGSQSRMNRFRVDWYRNQHTDYHPLYILFGFAAVVTAMALLARKSVKDSTNQHDEYGQKVEQIMNRYALLIEQNIERVNQSR